MRSPAAIVGGFVVTVIASIVQAYPEGAPWGAAHPEADETCATCHFSSDTIIDSPALSITGLPSLVQAGSSYKLTLSLVDETMQSAGFQMLLDVESAGFFASNDSDIETTGVAVRSVTAKSAEDSVSWLIELHTNDSLSGTIILHAAAVAANNDQSPLGDTVYRKSISIPTGH